MDTHSLHDEMLHSVFTTAIEGGLNYWAQVVDYHWCNADDSDDYHGFYAEIAVEATDCPTVLPGVVTNYGTATSFFAGTYDCIIMRIDRTVMQRGWVLASTRSENENHHQWQCGNGRPPLVITDDDDWDYDACDADAIAQLGLFGTTIFG